uniref:Uncharacterized protein n=1 Tax=Arundo donax TaxID=35708 RepID=A0A0A9DVI1_ARUDO
MLDGSLLEGCKLINCRNPSTSKLQKTVAAALPDKEVYCEANNAPPDRLMVHRLPDAGQFPATYNPPPILRIFCSAGFTW